MNLENSCRTCDKCYETPVTFVSIWLTLLPAVKIADALMTCAPVQISKTDGFPQNMCNKCVESLRNAYTFRAQCVEMEEKFKQKLGIYKEFEVPIDIKEELIDIKIENDESIFDPNENDASLIKVMDWKIYNLENNENTASYNCAICTQHFTNIDEFLSHAQTHSEREFTCYVCKRVFHRISSFSRHTLSHNEDKKPYQCSVCKKAFSSEDYLLKHSYCHDVKDEIEDVDDNKTPVASVEEDEKKEDICKYSSEVSEKSSYWRCSKCDKTLKNRAFFLFHMKRHTLGNIFICDHCSEDFPTKLAVKIHLKRQHYYPFKCGTCQKRFSTEKLLVEHKITHKKTNKSRSKKCPHCDKSFYQTCNLKEHVRTHTKERPYLCGICAKSFINPTSLRTHTMRHSQNKPFQCDTCSKTFHTKTQLVSHLRIHSEKELLHECDVCKKRFSSTSILNRHALIHTGEKTYTCDQCPRSFSYRYQLAKHKQRHLSTSFSCHLCSVSFKYKRNFNRHLIYHAKELEKNTENVGPNYQEITMTTDHGDNYPAVSYSKDNYPVVSYSKDNYPLVSYPKDDYPVVSCSTENYPRECRPEVNYPVESYSEDNYPVVSYSKDNYPLVSYPKDDYPVVSCSTENYPRECRPEDNNPAESYPQENYPEEMAPDKSEIVNVDTISLVLEIPDENNENALLSNPQVKVRFNKDK